jgi:hypothetical protein
MLVGLVVIDAELGKKGSILATAIERELEPFDVRTDSRPRFNWWWKKKYYSNRILLNI